jgi:hypothetical protein
MRMDASGQLHQIHRAIVTLLRNVRALIVMSIGHSSNSHLVTQRKLIKANSHMASAIRSCASKSSKIRRVLVLLLVPSTIRRR